MSIRDKAQKRLVKWKRALSRRDSIKGVTGLTDSALSRIYTGKGSVSDKQCQQVLSAKEPK